MITLVLYDNDGNLLEEMYQWDTGRSIVIKSSRALGGFPQFHFCNRLSEVAYVLTASETGSNNGIYSYSCHVPDQLLQQPETIIVYVYVAAEDGNRTIAHAHIPIQPRPKPTDYNYGDASQAHSEFAAINTAIAGLTGQINTINSDGWVTYDRLGASSVITEKLANGSVTTPKIADSAVTTDKIADGAITAGKIGDGAVNTINIINNAVTSDKIVASAITAAKIRDDTITAAKMAANSVGTSNLQNGAVTTDKIADGAVSLEKLQAGMIPNSKLANMPPFTVKGNVGSNRSVPTDLDKAALVTNFVMTGARTGYDGQGGFVPSPFAGDETKFLRGDGRWVTVESSGSSGGSGGGSATVPDLRASDIAVNFETQGAGTALTENDSLAKAATNINWLLANKVTASGGDASDLTVTRGNDSERDFTNIAADTSITLHDLLAKLSRWYGAITGKLNSGGYTSEEYDKYLHVNNSGEIEFVDAPSGGSSGDSSSEISTVPADRVPVRLDYSGANNNPLTTSNTMATAASKINWLCSNKLASNLGSANSGKYLAINPQGNVEPVTAPSGSGSTSVTEVYWATSSTAFSTIKSQLQAGKLVATNDTSTNRTYYAVTSYNQSLTGIDFVSFDTSNNKMYWKRISSGSAWTSGEYSLGGQAPVSPIAYVTFGGTYQAAAQAIGAANNNGQLIALAAFAGYVKGVPIYQGINSNSEYYFVSTELSADQIVVYTYRCGQYIEQGASGYVTGNWAMDSVAIPRNMPSRIQERRYSAQDYLANGAWVQITSANADDDPYDGEIDIGKYVHTISGASMSNMTSDALVFVKVNDTAQPYDFIQRDGKFLIIADAPNVTLIVNMGWLV